MGAAIGAAIATGERMVLIAGDGSFYMNLSELSTAVTEGISLVVLILNNECLGMVRQLQTVYKEGRCSEVEFARGTDFAAVARAFGARGYTVRSMEEAKKVLPEALSGGGTVVVDCHISQKEEVLPMTPKGGGSGAVRFSLAQEE